MNKDQNENLVIKKLRKTISEEKENTTRKTYGSDDGSPCRTSADDDDIAPETSKKIPKNTLPKQNKNTALTDRDARAHTLQKQSKHTHL
jgi:hypothetical protein